MVHWFSRVPASLTVTLGFLATFVHSNPFPGTLERRQGLAQVVYSCTVPNTVALTFDDGPWIYLREIADTLTAAGAKGTFFFNGNNFGCIYSPDNVANIRYVYAQGHQIASHTWSHPHLNSLSVQQITDEMSRVDEALIRIAGVNPAFIRPPFGEFNDAVRQVAASRGQVLTIWDYDSDGNRPPVGQSIDGYTDVAGRHPPTVLTLNHETNEGTVHQVLPHAIRVLQAAGYRLVTVADCLGASPYQSVAAPQTGSWSC